MITAKQRGDFNAALNLATSTMHDPAQAAQAMPRLSQLLTSVNAGLSSRQTWRKILTVTFNAQVSAAVPIAPFNFQFAKSYHVFGIKCAIAEGAANLPAVTVLVQKSDGFSFFTDQKGTPAYVSMSQMQGTSVDNLLGYYPIEEYVLTNEQWSIGLKSATAGPWTPEVTFLVEPWDPRTDPVPGKSQGA